MAVTDTPTAQRLTQRRSIALLLALAVLAAACGSGESDTINLGSDPLAPDVEVGEVEPSDSGDVIDFSYKTFEGSTAAFSGLPEGPVVVNFFASWCPTCVAELPDFESVAQDLDGQVEFLGLSTSDRKEDSEALIETTGITFATGLDESGEIFQLFEGLAMPTTVFLDADHRVVRVHSGVFNAETLTQTIDEELLS